MILLKQSWQFLTIPDGDSVLSLIERAGRTCYKSENKMTPDSAKTFVKRILSSGHHSVIEHPSVTVRIITDRGVTHEIVRHRLASYSQESTRYCNYKGGVTFILPAWTEIPPGEYAYDSWGQLSQTEFVWFWSMLDCEKSYKNLLEKGWHPQQARSVLPNSLKTEIVMTANAREWRHFFTLRCNKAAHPQMRDLALDMLKGFKAEIPVLFDDLGADED
jgi:thymidylate synthase (FAD)